MTVIRQRQPGSVKRALLIGAGFVTLVLGILMLFLPGPGLLFILVGLGILARELPWARYILIKLKKKIRRKKSQAPDLPASR